MSQYTRNFNWLFFSPLPSALCPCSNTYAAYLFFSGEHPFSSILIHMEFILIYVALPLSLLSLFPFIALHLILCSVHVHLKSLLCPHNFFLSSVPHFVFNPVSVSCHSGESQILGLRCLWLNLFFYSAFLPHLPQSSGCSIIFLVFVLCSLALLVSSNTYECQLQHLTMLDGLYQIPSMYTHFEGLPPGNHPLSAGSASYGYFESSSLSRQSPNQSIRSSPLIVTLSSVIPGRCHVKSPAL